MMDPETLNSKAPAIPETLTQLGFLVFQTLGFLVSFAMFWYRVPPNPKIPFFMPLLIPN